MYRHFLKTINDAKIKAGEKFGLADLFLNKGFNNYEIFEVFIINNDFEEFN